MTGVNGDYYLNTTTGNIFQKVSGTWVLTGNIKGPIGNGLYINHVAPSPPYAGMLWIQANTIYLRDDSNASWYQVYPPIVSTSKVRAYNSSMAQTLTKGQPATKIYFPNKEFDVINEFDTTLYRFIAQTSGYYLISATIGSTSSSTSTLNIYIYKNGTSHTAIYQNTTYPHVIVIDVIYLNVSDYIEIWGSSGSSVTNTLQLGQANLWMAITKI